MDTQSVQRTIDDLSKQLGVGHWQNSTYWPYQVEIQNWYDISGAERFCYENFKSCNWRNITRYFAFKNKKDYEWFVIKWA